jgi:hypothetical protein
LILHKILRGDQAGLYLPLALSRIKALERVYGTTGFFQQKYILEGYNIEVSQYPPFQYVRITQGAVVSYEFFTSEHVQDTTLASPDHAHGLANSYVCGSATRASFDGSGAAVLKSPRYSSSILPPVPGQWAALNCEYPETPLTRLTTWRSWQNQKFFEHTWHPNNDGKSLVTSTQAQCPGWANQCNWNSPYRTLRFGNIGANISDEALDVAPTLYTKGSTVSGAPQLEHGWLYWRRAAVQNGFFISTDNYGRFQVYPVKNYTAPVTAFKTFTPPYPGWVTIPDPADYTHQFCQWLWRFNKDGTKCVAIPFHSDDTSWKKYLNQGDSLAFCAIDPATAGDIIPPAALVTAHEDTPGLVEFGITVTRTGAGDLDFDVVFTLLRNNYFGDTGRFFFDAAYFMPDVEKFGIAEDTLMTAEVECKVPTGYFSAGPVTNAWAVGAIDACRAMQSAIVINANDVGMAATEKFRFTAIGPTWFQFPVLGDTLGASFGFMPTQAIPTTTGTRPYAPAGPCIYDPDSHVVAGRMWSGPLNVGVTYGFLYALELSTLSLCYEQDDEVAGTASVRTVVYGKEIHRYDVSLGYTLPANGAPAATDAVPSARAHQNVLNFTINTDWGQGFNVHPLGHWSFGLGGIRNSDMILETALDWVSVVGGKNVDGTLKRKRFTHKDLFNSAFKQTRDYSFYHTPFVGESLGDYGSFRTAGFWVTFR